MLHTLMDTPFNGHLVDTSFWDKAKIRRVYCINPENSPSLGCKVPMTGSIQTGPRKDTWCRWSVWGIDSAPKAGWFHDHWMDVPGRIDWNSMEFLNVGQKICGVPVHLPLDQFCMSKQGEKKHFQEKDWMLKTNICISKLGFTKGGHATNLECDVMGQFEVMWIGQNKTTTHEKT